MLLSFLLGLFALASVAQGRLKKFESTNFVLVDRGRGVRWNRGQRYCRSRLKTNLATIDSAEKQAELAKLMRDNGYTTDKHKAWLGGRDSKNEGRWRWRGGEDFDYTNWNNNEPNGNNRENCLMTWPHADYRWNDGVCYSRSICKMFVCDKPDPHVKGEHFTYVRTPMNWEDANAYCKAQFDSELASVMNGPQSDHLYEVIYKHARAKSRQNVWIGLDGNDNPGDWQWVGGEQVCYGNWASGEGDGNPELGCGALFRKQWRTRDCDFEYPFVCQNGDEEDDEEDCDCDGKGNDCDVPEWAVKKGGLYWAWASPCSGRCSQAELKYGWRYASEEEWENVPSKEEFYRDGEDDPDQPWCAAKVFDPKWDHCDKINKLVRIPDNWINEQVLVHDDCSPPPCNCDGEGNDCDKASWAVEKGGLYWAWASPCSGGCSQAELKYGWRYATPEEWENVPAKEEFDRPGVAESDWCAAKIFDPKYNHCDEGDDFVRVPNGNNHEQILVHDKGCAAPAPAPECQCADNTPCSKTGYAHFDDKTKLFWAWASPCSGGCSKLKNPIPFGWRRATEAEWNAKGFKCDEAGLKFFGYDLAWDHGADGQQINSGDYPDTCASNVFDEKYKHCDAINFKDGRCTYKEEQNYWETLIVHDSDPAKCAAAQNDAGLWNIAIEAHDPDMVGDTMITVGEEDYAFVRHAARGY